MVSQSDKRNPLKPVLARVKTWFDLERQHGHEVRFRHIQDRTKFEIQFERDRQVVLQEHQHPKFQPALLQACKDKLDLFETPKQIGLKTSKKLETYMHITVLQHIKATVLCGQQMSTSDTRCDREKFKITTAGIDYCIQLISQAKDRRDELQSLVADPAAFAENYKKTSVFVLDETALWLKLRGEEKVYQSLSEVLSSHKRKEVKRAINAASKYPAASLPRTSPTMKR